MCKSKQGNKTENTWASCYHLGRSSFTTFPILFPWLLVYLDLLYLLELVLAIAFSQKITRLGFQMYCKGAVQSTSYHFFKMSSYYQLCSFSHPRLYLYVQSFILLIWFIYLFYFIFSITPTCLFVESTGFGFCS